MRKDAGMFMRRSLLSVLALSLVSYVFFCTVRAEDNASGGEKTEPVPDTLAEDLGFQTEVYSQDSFDPDRNTVNLLNHMIVLSEEIEQSPNGRLLAEEAYSFLHDNIRFEAVDESVKAQLDGSLETLGSLRMLAGKKDKAKEILRHNQALALGAVVDEPVALLTYARPFDLIDIAASGFSGSLDSSQLYTAFENQVDPYYLQEGMALRKEEHQLLSEKRNELIQYRNDFIKSRNLPAEYAIGEEAVNLYAECRNNRNASQRIQFLEENRDTWSQYPGYWALYAQSCFEAEEYKKCLDSVYRYEQLSGHVYIKDHVYAELIPSAIGALMETVSVTDRRVKEIARLNEQLIRNTETEDWALRYFAAHAYLEISRASDNPYLKPVYLNNAYVIMKSAVTYLAEEQRNSNRAYMQEIVPVQAPSGASVAEKKEIRDYNRLLKEDRKTARPPVSKALLVSVDLLNPLMEKTGADEQEKQSVNEILHQDGQRLFLNAVYEGLYKDGLIAQLSADAVTFDKKKVSVPAAYLSGDYAITVTVQHGDLKYIFKDWTVDEIVRENTDDCSTFTARLTSDDNSHFRYGEDMQVTVEVIPVTAVEYEPVTVMYQTVSAKIFFFIDSVNLERVN